MVPGLRDVELDSWLRCSEEARDASSGRPRAKMYRLDVRLRLAAGPLNCSGMLGFAAEWPVRAGIAAGSHTLFLHDVSQTDYSLLMCSLTMCTHFVVSC